MKLFIKKRAFTLVEVLIALVILVLVIGAVTAIESKNIQFGTNTKLQIQANSIAQEALNFTKKANDQYQLEIQNNPSATPTNLDAQNLSNSTDYPDGIYYLDDQDHVEGCPADKVCLGPGSKPICSIAYDKVVNGKSFKRTVLIGEPSLSGYSACP